MTRYPIKFGLRIYRDRNFFDVLVYTVRFANGYLRWKYAASWTSDRNRRDAVKSVERLMKSNPEKYIETPSACGGLPVGFPDLRRLADLDARTPEWAVLDFFKERGFGPE